MIQEQLSLRGRGGGWWRVLLTGFLAYLGGIFVLVLTGNPILFPTVALIGCFTIPVTYVAFFYERRHLSQFNMPTTARSFLYGGVLGVFASGLLESLFPSSTVCGTGFPCLWERFSFRASIF